ncbi:hypothetical protein K437DRAFT_100241 [Tilletiaria anomala UBC 951]|uniref:Uncharacterized protein n=1 Tax=Tilletiaria anomala (strain ATCC 24038 / CBS 436.72 / UBC 951) TaxID=1037660 RepID=A0A066W098_TILAU|nr:uncharacterized protein K437DRAFT_100241 [Tilletiaria anomala UBC 951]KDN47362.1 hypothetical protein K437DRAFT_100241 [Tilletiaria anomala UBC 951]
MQASRSFELSREGRMRPANLSLSSSSGPTPERHRHAQAAEYSSGSGSSGKSVRRSTVERSWASPSFNPSLSLSTTHDDDVFANPSRRYSAAVATAKDVAMSRSTYAVDDGNDEDHYNELKSGGGAQKKGGVRQTHELPPTPITASNATFKEAVNGSIPLRLPSVEQMLSNVASPASPTDSILSTPLSEHYAAYVLTASAGGSGGSIGGGAACSRFDLRLPPLKSPLEVKDTKGYTDHQLSPEFVRPLGSGCLSLVGLGSLSSGMGMTRSSSGEFAGPRAEWAASPSNKSRTLMGVRPPAPPTPSQLDHERGRISPGSWSSRPRDGDIVGLGLQLDITPKASMSTPLGTGAAATGGVDTNVSMGIPFMPPRLPGAPRLGVLGSGRFENVTPVGQSGNVAISPILPPLRGWNTDLRFDNTAFRPPALPSPSAERSTLSTAASSPARHSSSSANGSNSDEEMAYRATPMERERTVQLDAGLPKINGLVGLGVRLLGSGGTDSQRTPVGTPTQTVFSTGRALPVDSSLAMVPPLNAGSFTPIRQQSTIGGVDGAAAASSPSFVLPFSVSKSTGLTPSLKGASLGKGKNASPGNGLSSPLPSPSFREQSKLRSRQLVQTATTAVAAVAAVQQATNTPNIASSVLTASAKLQRPPLHVIGDDTNGSGSGEVSGSENASSDDEGTSTPLDELCAINETVHEQVHRAKSSSTKAAARQAAADLEEQQKALADSSPWGVFSTTKAWRPLAPPGMSASAFIKKQKKLQQQQQLATAAEASRKSPAKRNPALPDAATDASHTAKKQRTVLGIKSANVVPSSIPVAGEQMRSKGTSASLSAPTASLGEKSNNVENATSLHVSPRRRAREHSANRSFRV